MRDTKPNAEDRRQARLNLEMGPPRYMSKNPVRVTDSGKPVHSWSRKPATRETTYVPDSKSYRAGAGRGDPKMYETDDSLRHHKGTSNVGAQPKTRSK